MKWVTRERPKVDRVACPWLIRRFIDPTAEFLYVAADQVSKTAELQDAVPFDVPDVELGHHGPECSFDAIVRKYELTDPALAKLALIVRGADTAAKHLTPESPGLEAIAEGFRLAFADDHELLEREMAVYDALYAYCRARAVSTETQRGNKRQAGAQRHKPASSRAQAPRSRSGSKRRASRKTERRKRA